MLPEGYVITAKLQDAANFVQVVNGAVYYGGQQNWLCGLSGVGGRRYWYSKACAPTAMANVLAYLARYDVVLAAKLGISFNQGQISKAQMLNLIAQMYDAIKPGVFGKQLTGLKKSLAQYLGHGKFNLVPNAVKRQRPGDYAALIKRELSHNNPVVMLVGFLKQEITVFYPDNRLPTQAKLGYHYVTITALAESTAKPMLLKIQTWGGYAWVDLNAFLVKTAPAGLIYLSPKQAD